MDGGSDHLLVIRLSAMGDVAMTVHALRALHASHPGVRVTMLTRPQFFPFFREWEGGEFIRFLSLGEQVRHRGLLGLWQIARAARAVGVTAVADLHDVLRTKALRYMLRVMGCRTGAIRKDKSLRSRATRPDGKNLEPVRHTVLRYCDVFRDLGYAVADPAVERRRRPMPAPFASVEGATVGLAPFSKQQSKSYPEPNAERLVGLLAREYAMVYLFSGGGDELRFARRMEERHSNVRSVYGRIPLDRELDLMANLDAVVTMDSSAMHMASLVGVPILSLWGATHPATGFSGYGTTACNYVQLTMRCRPCSVYGNITCRYGDYHCLRDLQPEWVVEHLRALLARGPEAAYATDTIRTLACDPACDPA